VIAPFQMVPHMKLFYAPQSPFARKARITIRELALPGIEEIAVNPFETPAALLATNPLSKVPTLVLDDGSALYDSPVICEYLASLGSQPAFLPASGPARWTVLRRHALADGLLDAAFNIACETMRRPEHERSPDWIRRWLTAIERGLDVLELEAASFGNSITLAHVVTACLLTYLDLRLSDRLDWRLRCPALARWHAEFSLRPSLQATVPPGLNP
jgi:glutathione S-transferase